MLGASACSPPLLSLLDLQPVVSVLLEELARRRRDLIEQRCLQKGLPGDFGRQGEDGTVDELVTSKV